ncbi:MAG: exodeoxyribonuclease VII small subunit [Erysipelotrichaceae bacterium]
MKEDKSFKNRMQRLEDISSSLEKNDMELESAIALFEEGLQLVNACDQQLKGFENKVQELLNTYQGGNGDENL